MDLLLKDKVVVITGAAKGIGLATVKSFLQEKANVIALDIQFNNLPISENHHHFQVDLKNEEKIKETLHQIALKFNKIDVLVNNAAIFHFADTENSTSTMLDEIYEVNIKSYFLMAKYAIPLLKKSENPVIVNLSSGVAFQYQKGMAAYSMSKTAILGFTRALAVDYAPWLRAVTVCPGATLTPSLQRDINQKQGKEREKFIKATQSISLLNRIGTSNEVADFIAFISSKRASYCTGHAFRIDGGVGIKIEGDK
jgi:NAD(P)-dependent dehydrogenase (short-subunit alcohol dehydrogenase family)